MLFNSFEFLIFFPVVTILYFVLPSKYRWVLLLISSYIFYMAWKPIYVLLIVVSTLIDYTASIQMEKQKVKSKKRLFLLLSLFSNLGILFIFKYFNMFAQSFSMLTGGEFDALQLILPMGISFYTFQTLSYTIDVYLGKRKAEKHLGYFALYVTYFPQLVAGPIERSDRLLPQLKSNHKFDYDRVTDGLKRMTWGFFKKVVIADNLATIVNNAYKNSDTFEGLPLLFATILFAIQIYCDFSGYSDIAIGCSKVMGVDLMENFKRPYLSKSIKEFWTRWHISLSTWFRDYVYIPLGGSKVSVSRTYFNVCVVFLVSGLWHGADWKFVVWGGIHAVWTMFENATYNLRNKIWSKIRMENSVIRKVLGWIVTMTVVIFAWVFFRANNTHHALYICKKIIVDIMNIKSINEIKSVIDIIYVNKDMFIIGAMSTMLLIIDELILEFGNRNLFKLFQNTKFIKWGFYYAVIVWIILMGNYGSAEFIYFQF